MTPTGQLKEEHQGILLMLTILEKVCQRMDAGEDPDPTHVERILEFLKVFVDRCHHAKEEECLFPAMERAGVPREGGTIEAMLSDHAAGRGRVLGMSEAAEAIRRGDRSGTVRFTENARSYIDLLRSHIDKEDTVLYPIADAHLSLITRKVLEGQFEKVEEERVGHGRHEEFHRMMGQLETIYLG